MLLLAVEFNSDIRRHIILELACSWYLVDAWSQCTVTISGEISDISDLFRSHLESISILKRCITMLLSHFIVHIVPICLPISIVPVGAERLQSHDSIWCCNTHLLLLTTDLTNGGNRHEVGCYFSDKLVLWWRLGMDRWFGEYEHFLLIRVIGKGTLVAYPIKISSVLAALFLWPILSLLYLTNTGALLMILSCWRGDESNMLSIIANIFLSRVLICLHRVYRCCWLQRLCLIKSSNFTPVDVIVLILGIGIALKVNLLLIILLHR